MCNIAVESFPSLLKLINCLLGMALPVLVTLAVVAFVYGVISYYLNPGNEEKRKKGKEFITGGLIALFIIVSVWGLVAVLVNTLNLPNEIPPIPRLPEI